MKISKKEIAEQKTNIEHYLSRRNSQQLLKPLFEHCYSSVLDRNLVKSIAASCSCDVQPNPLHPKTSVRYRNHWSC